MTLKIKVTDKWKHFKLTVVSIIAILNIHNCLWGEYKIGSWHQTRKTACQINVHDQHYKFLSCRRNNTHLQLQDASLHHYTLQKHTHTYTHHYALVHYTHIWSGILMLVHKQKHFHTSVHNISCNVLSCTYTIAVVQLVNLQREGSKNIQWHNGLM